MAVLSSMLRMRKACMPFGTSQHLAVHARSLVSRLETTGSEARDVKKDVRQAIVRHDEAVALGCIEPLDHSSDFEDLERCVVYSFGTG